jgi:hypothetical protein
MKKTLMFLTKNRKNLGVDSIDYIKLWLSDFHFHTVSYSAVDEIVKIIRVVNIKTKTHLVELLRLIIVEPKKSEGKINAVYPNIP